MQQTFAEYGNKGNREKAQDLCKFSTVGHFYVIIVLYICQYDNNRLINSVGLTILSSCVVGGAMITCALDYFVEMLGMSYYVWERVLAEHSSPVCWFSWILLGLWPATVMVGMLAQWKVTARGHTLHKQGIIAHIRFYNQYEIYY